MDNPQKPPLNHRDWAIAAPAQPSACSIGRSAEPSQRRELIAFELL
ncbi:MAG: hypothetical protein ACFB0G_02560 [Leptolyngbyaceae cyanobacterium]